MFKPTTDKLLGIVHPGSLRKEYEVRKDLDISNLFFTEPNEVLKTADGIEVLVVKAWHGDEDLQRLIDRAKEFGIVVKNFEKVKPGVRGSYSWEIFNPVLAEKIKSPEAKKIQESEVKKTQEPEAKKKISLLDYYFDYSFANSAYIMANGCI